MILLQPESYRIARNEQKQSICNGTGASGSPKWLVMLLDNLFGFGLNVKAASNIHDWQYFMYKTWYGKIIADIVFLINICLLAIADCLQHALHRRRGMELATGAASGDWVLIGCIVNCVVCACRRWDLHQGGGRWCRPRGQG